jgi:hypothetical protein
MLLEQSIRAATVAEAAISVCVCPTYIVAARQVLRTSDEQLVKDVLRGNLSLMAAADRARARLDLLRGFQNATPADLSAFVAVVGVGKLWDTVIVPQL